MDELKDSKDPSEQVPLPRWGKKDSITEQSYLIVLSKFINPVSFFTLPETRLYEKMTQEMYKTMLPENHQKHGKEDLSAQS